jgi:endoglucanase Acf2
MSFHKTLGATALVFATFTACQPVGSPTPENPTNNSPVVTSNPITSALTRAEYRYVMTVTDEDGDDVTLSELTVPDWLTFDVQTGELTGTPSIHDVGSFEVELGYYDGTVSLVHEFDVDVAQSPNSIPVVTSLPVTEISAEDAYRYEMTVTDADADIITLSAINLPSWLNFNASNGLLSGVPERTQIGDFSVTLGYSDGLSNQEHSFTVSVAEGYFLDPVVPPVAKAPVVADDPSTYTITAYGAGSISDGINSASYGCVEDYGTWIYNAGIVEPGVAGCSPIGAPTKRHPQVIGDATELPVPTHKWWGSVSFHGEMTIGDSGSAAYITPDPITARISNVGVRVASIPAGLGEGGNGYLYQVPDPFSEVFDGIAIANTEFSDLDAYVFDYSDASVTVQWQDGSRPVMRATFVHGSPFIYFKAFRGELIIKAKAADGGEKGIFYDDNESIGVWTSVAGNRGDFLFTGEGETTFSNMNSAEIIVSNATNEMTLALLPSNNGSDVTDATVAFFEEVAREVVDHVTVDYSVDRNTNEVTVTHSYLDANDQPVNTVAGLHPMHWKNSDANLSGHKMRSARGVVQFSKTSEFSYTMPFVGVLPYLPSNLGATDIEKLKGLVYEFLAEDSATWNTHTDTYWAGKNYGKVSELAAIAQSIGMETEAEILLNWLKAELSDWFTADSNGSIDTNKYFVYDDEWDTLLGLDESFASHQQLNDHHFHYGYFVRAAAEICRQDSSWCGDDQYGPMVELLIRDYAGSKDDDLFPYLRNFDPANGFSWASGNANFALGNNNESTSEAANSYGAIVLYGLITGDDALVEKGMYLHASSTTAYWEYWNNIDRYLETGDDYDNFPSYYNRITTSIIWGHGSVFSTWFSGAYAHILGIQGLPTNPLSLHIGQYADYMVDYVALGLEESSNNKPSGLVEDMWRDIWWNLWAMTDADAAIEDYNTMPVYNAEAGESKAHTYQWLHAWKQLGHLLTGTGDVTSNDPAAIAFDKDGVITYLAYNFTGVDKIISFSDGHSFTARANGMSVSLSTDNVLTDVTAPTAPATTTVSYMAQTKASFSWAEATDNTRVAYYSIIVEDASTNIVQQLTTEFTQINLTGLVADSDYEFQVYAVDPAGNVSACACTAFTTASDSDDLAPLLKGSVSVAELGPISATLSWLEAEEDNAIDGYTITVTDGAAENYSVTTTQTSTAFGGLTQGTAYSVTVTAEDDAAQTSNTISGSFTTLVNPYTSGCDLICVEEVSATALKITVQESNVVVFHHSLNGVSAGGVHMIIEGGEAVYELDGLTVGDQVLMAFTVIPISGGAFDVANETYYFTGSF